MKPLALLLLCSLPTALAAQHRDLVLQRAEPGRHVNFSRDGRFFATTTEYGGTTALWETTTGRLYRELPAGNQSVTERTAAGGTGRSGEFGSAGFDVVFSPDGRYVAAVPISLRAFDGNGTWAGSAPVVWEIATGKVMAPASTWERKDGMLLNPALPWTGSELSAWGVVADDAAAHALRNYRGPARLLARDGRTAAAYDTATKSIRVFDVFSDRLIDRVPVQQYGFSALAISPDARWLALRRDRRGLSIYDLNARQRVRLLHPDTTDFYTIAQFSPDARYLAVATDTRVRLFDTRTWTLLQTTASPYHAHYQGAVEGLSFSPDGRLLAVTGDVLRILEVPTLRVQHDSVGTHMTPIEAWTAHENVVAVARNQPESSITDWIDSRIEVWPLSGGAPFLVEDTIEAVADLAVSPDGSMLAAGTAHGHVIGRYTHMVNGDVHVWDLRARKPLIQGDWENDHVSTVRFTPDGKRLLATRHFQIEPEEQPCEEDEYCGAPEGYDYDIALTSIDPHTQREDTIRSFAAGGSEHFASAVPSRFGERYLVYSDDDVFMYDFASRGRLDSFRPDSGALISWQGGFGQCVPDGLHEAHFDQALQQLLIIDGGAVLLDARTGGVLYRDSVWRIDMPAVINGGFAADGTAFVITCNSALEEGVRIGPLTVSDSARHYYADDDWRALEFRADGSFFARAGNLLGYLDKTGVPLAWLLWEDSGDWLVVTPDGHYDGTAGGQRLAAWRVADRTVLLKERGLNFRVPGLLQRLIAGERAFP